MTASKSRSSVKLPELNYSSGLVHTYPFSFESATSTFTREQENGVFEFHFEERLRKVPVLVTVFIVCVWTEEGQPTKKKLRFQNNPNTFGRVLRSSRKDHFAELEKCKGKSKFINLNRHQVKILLAVLKRTMTGTWERDLEVWELYYYYATSNVLPFGGLCSHRSTCLPPSQRFRGKTAGLTLNQTM